MRPMRACECNRKIMEREEEQKSSEGSVVGVGVVCSVIGAIIGAVGYHFWKKEEEQQRQRHLYSGSGKVFSDGTCPICLSEMEELRVLPCGHQYHNGCIKRLIEAEANPKCPMCRKDCNK